MKNTSLIIITFIFLISFSFNGQGEIMIGKMKHSSIEKTLADTNGADFGDWIIIHQFSDPEKLNPIVTYDVSAQSIYTYMYEPLIEIDRTSYELKPVIAKSAPEISPDHLTYTFLIKDNVTFSDGENLTGEDVIFTFKTILNPFTDADAYRNLMSDFVKAELVNGNKYKLRNNYVKTVF